MRADLESVCAAARRLPPGAQLRMLREAAKCSQRALAERCGLPQSTISRLESGADAPISTWIRVIESLGGSLYFQFNDEDYVLDLEYDGIMRKDRQLGGLKQFQRFKPKDAGRRR